MIGCRTYAVCAPFHELTKHALEFQATNRKHCKFSASVNEKVIFNQQNKACFSLFCVLLYVIQELVHGLASSIDP